MFLLSKPILDLIITINKAHFRNLFMTRPLFFKSFLTLFPQFFLPQQILFLCHTLLLSTSTYIINTPLLLSFNGTSLPFCFLSLSDHFLFGENLIYKGTFSSLDAK